LDFQCGWIGVLETYGWERGLYFDNKDQILGINGFFESSSVCG
jgi:hypothetical protein